MKREEIKKITYNLTVIALIALIFVFGLQMRPKARLESEDEIIARLQKENEDNPESTSYLITDEYVSNVLPETTVENLKKNIKEVVKVYEDESKEVEVTTGKIKTGMVIEYVDNLRIYGLSVLGDLDRDGSLNQIELTREIRDIEKTEGWNISEQIDIYSGDIKRNGKIDRDDIESIIEYIVYGKLETNKFETILKPEIKVTSGNFKVDRYDSNVEIQVTQKDENGQRTVYKVTDSNESEDGQYIEIENSENIKIEKDGIYKITAYTYGVEGNKSKGETVIIVREKPTYTVKYLAGEHGKFETQVTNKLYIGDDTPEFEGEIEGEDGYKFTGWSEEIDKTVIGNKEYIAMWEPIEYTIEYDLDGGKVVGINPEKYTIESENIILNNPSKDGYKFLGWQEEKEEKIEEIVTIETGSTGNKKYTAKWEGVTGVPYTVKIYKMDTTGKYEEKVTEYRGKTDEIINLDTTAEEGFTYEDKLSTSSGKIKADGSTELEIYFSRNQYTIRVIAGKGIGEIKVDKENGKTIEKKIYYEAEVTIGAKTEKGYTWVKYISKNNRVENIEEQETKIKMPIGDIELTAVGEINEYKIEYDLEGGSLKAGESNPSKYTVETETIILINPNKYGYNFTGWTGSNGEEAEEVVAIEKGSIGNKAYKANWEGAEGTEYTVKTYIMNVEGEYEETIEKYAGRTDEIIELTPKAEKGFTYEENISIPRGKVLVDGSTVLKIYFSRNKYSVELVAEEGVEKVEGANEYYYGAEVIINANVKEGYEWNSWENNGQEASKEQNYTFNMPAENVELIAKTEPIEYLVSYELNGGEVRIENPVSYTIETESFTLNNPEKLGYIFIGWTGDNGEIAEKEVTIEKGSTGNKEYIANWEKKSYTINYELNGGEVRIENPVSYTIETESFTLNNPEKLGYTFIGWTGDNGEIAEKEVTIEKGSTGNKEYIANWEMDTYLISYELNGGEVRIENPVSYTIETESFTLNNPEKLGYTFIGWTGDNGEIAEKEVTIEKGSTGNKEYIANWEINEYTITYNPNEGIVNPTSTVANYNEPITMPIPERNYTVSYNTNGGSDVEEEIAIYGFEGWYTEKVLGEKREYTVMPAYNETLYAHWKENSIVLGETNKKGYTFEGWYIDEELTEKVGNIGDTYIPNGDITLYANWTINSYTITVHHKEDERETKVAEDETFIGDYNEEYNITDLLTNNGENGRTVLNADKYYYVRTEGTAEGKYEEDIEITFYYGVSTFNISGIAEEGGSISDISEEIRYGENSSKDIIITPEQGRRVANITINGTEIEFEEDEDTKVVNLTKFENVIEDKEIVVTFEDIIMVARIVSSPNEDLVGTEYDSLKKALSILNDTGLNEESDETTIEIISTIEDESNVVENQNVIIDLAGNRVTSLQNVATLTVRRANLRIIDSVNEGGTIKNTQTVGIEVQEEGTLTLGEDDGNVWQTSPTIEGINYGVNNKGTFNYYDGVIIGKIAINGTVKDLPYLKNPGITNEEGMQVATLATILDAEATIGKKTFTQLELAIEYANEKVGTDGSQVEIVIVKDLTKEEEIIIDNSKNIKLNLNGYTTTFNTNLVNNGKVEIIDEIVSEIENERIGRISFPSNKLLNNENASITLTSGIISGSLGGTDKLYDSSIINNGKIVVDGGTITSNGKYSYTIKNAKSGELTLNTGNISSTGSYNHSIYNLGNVTVNGGTITSSNSTGIYNVEEGNAIVNAGTITAYCGIYNTSKGNVIVTSVNINASYGIDNRNTGKVEVSNAIIKVTNAYYGIYNYSNGEINLENVDISSNYYAACGIYNRIDGKITVTESKIDIAISSNYSSNGIKNYGVGTILLNNVTISAYYGVYNNSSGIITIKDSIIEESRYGIYNSGKGTVTVTEGTINAYVSGIYNSTGEVILTDVNIIQNGRSTTSYAGIHNSNTGNIIVKGGEIDAASYGITNTGTGTITITNGAIINSTYYDGIYNGKTGIITIEDAEISTSGSSYRGIYNESNGTINIGNVEDEINNESPKIISSNIGIYNLYGTLNFYDGTIKALNDKVLMGKVTSMPEKAELLITQNDDETETAVLGNYEAVVKIGETSYSTLEKAIEASNDGDIIIYQKNAVISNKVTIDSIKNIVIDLAGNTIRMYNQIENQGNLKITDSSKTEETNGTGTVKTYGISGIINSECGILTIEEGTMINNVSGSSNSTYVCLIQNYGECKIINGNLSTTGKYNFAINNKNTGELTIEGGTIKSSGENSDGIWNYGILLIKAGTITVYNNGIFTREEGMLTITGGTINATGNNGAGINHASTSETVISDENINSKYYGIYNNGTGKLTITDTTITTSGNYGVYNNATGAIEILGGEITANYGIYNKSTGELKVVGTQITSNTGSSGDRYGIYNYSTGMITLRDANITTSSNSYSCGIYNSSSGNVIIDNISLTVTNNSSSNCTGIYNKTGEIVLKSGTIDVEHIDTKNNTSYHAYGICNDSTGTVTIGEISGEVSTSLPSITAIGTTNSYGIYNTKGILNFYDGIVTGTEGYAIYNLISDQEEGYEVIREINEDGTESATLQKLAIAQIVSTGEKYYNLQDAINEIGANKETVQILRDALLAGTTETLVINENKNVVIDLNGKTVEVGNINTIQNDGILEIVDSSKTEQTEGTGMLINTAAGTKDEYKTLITNNGEMKLTEGTLKITGDYGRVILNNTGATLEVNGGKIVASVNKQCFGIYNLETTNVNGGKINSEVNSGNANDCSYGISTEGEGKLTITDGEITVSSIGGYSPGGYRYSTISKAINSNTTGTTKIIGGTISVTKGTYIYTVINNNVGEIIIKNANIIAPTTSSNYYGIYNASTGNIAMENATIEAYYGIYNNSAGTIETLDGEIIAYYGIYNKNTGKVEVVDTQITANSGSSNSFYGIYNYSTGTVTIVGIQMIANSGNSIYGIYNYSTGMITLRDANITTSSNSYSCGIYNNSSGNVIIENISLTVTNNSSSNCTGIYNKTGEIVLKSGTIDIAHTDTRNNTNYHSYGIFNDSTGIITIGEKNGEINSSLPSITATGTTNSYGIYNTKGILNFYDGIVTGTEGYALYKLISDQEEGYEVIKEINEDGTESATLKILPLAQIVSTGVEYNSIQEAIEMIGENDTETIQILRNGIISTSSKEILIKEGQEITIDLNGYTVTLCKPEMIKNNGKLEIKDSSKTDESEGTGILETFKETLIANNEGAILTISSGTLTNMIAGESNAWLSEIINNGEMNITGGTIKSNGSYVYAINNESTGKLEMTGGIITASVNYYTYGIYNTGKTKIIDGTINLKVTSSGSSCRAYGIYNGGSGELVMTGGIINSTGAGYSYGIRSNTTGVTTVTGVTITAGDYGILNNNIGKITVENSKITTNEYGIYNNSAGEIEVKGGEVKSNHYAIYNNSSGTINIEDADIIATSTSRDTYGIENYETGKIVLKSGSIQATYTGTSSYKAYGIHNRSTGTITIGVKDRNVKNDVLTIQGTTNGVYINNLDGNIYFYDGTIIGNAKAIYGEIDEVEEGYELNITENETKATLKIKDATVESVASVGNIYYDTIQEAVNAIEETGTIQIHKEIEQNTQVIIETGKNITIDMQAHGITYEKAEPVIVIEEGATLSILDSYEDGTDETIYGQIQNTSGIAIKNQGILYIGIDDSEVYRNSPRIEGTTAIENTGELYIYDGTITGGISGTGITEDKR